MAMAGHTQTLNGAQPYNYDPSNTSNNRLRTASLSTSDEGIVMDYSDETPRKRRVSDPILAFVYYFLIICAIRIDQNSFGRADGWRLHASHIHPGGVGLIYWKNFGLMSKIKCEMETNKRTERNH